MNQARTRMRRGPGRPPSGNNEPSFLCDYCDREFLSRHGLVYHLNAAHTKETWYRCPCKCRKHGCPNIRLRRSTILKHIKAKHPHGGKGEDTAMRKCGGRLKPIEFSREPASRGGEPMGKIPFLNSSPLDLLILPSNQIFQEIKMPPNLSHPLTAGEQHEVASLPSPLPHLPLEIFALPEAVVLTPQGPLYVPQHLKESGMRISFFRVMMIPIPTKYPQRGPKSSM